MTDREKLPTEVANFVQRLRRWIPGLELAEGGSLQDKAAAVIESLAADIEKWKGAERHLSNAYVRLRIILNALDTPHAPSAEQIWEHTENCANAQAAALEAATTRAEKAEQRQAQLEGRLCLICGAKEPCELDKSEMSPCTFDPSPIEAAKAFLRRAEKVEAEITVFRRMLGLAPKEPFDFGNSKHVRAFDRLMRKTP